MTMKRAVEDTVEPVLSGHPRGVGNCLIQGDWPTQVQVPWLKGLLLILNKIKRTEHNNKYKMQSRAKLAFAAC